MPQKPEPFDESDAITVIPAKKEDEPFDESDAIPATVEAAPVEEAAAPEVPANKDLPVEEQGPSIEAATTKAGGHWAHRGGLASMFGQDEYWVPDKPVDLENRPDSQMFGGYQTLIDKAKENYTHNPIADKFPRLAKAGATAMGMTSNLVMDSIADPTIFAGAGALSKARIPAVDKLLEVMEGTANPAMKSVGGAAVATKPLKLSEGEIRELAKGIRRSKNIHPDIRVQAGSGLKNILLGKSPLNDEVDALTQVFGEDTLKAMRATLPKIQGNTLFHEAVNLPRALQSSFDLSYPFRQGAGLIHTKAWWTSWDDMVKAAGSDKAYQGVMDSILEKPNFYRPVVKGKVQKSFAEKVGMKLTDLKSMGQREEQFMSTWAERIPGVGRIVKGSERAYTAFANKLRADTFDSMIKDAERIYRSTKTLAKTPEEMAAAELMDPYHNLEVAKDIAAYINNASGRGSLDFSIKSLGIHANLEKHAVGLNNVFFSPRLIASRIQMMNPVNYIAKSKQVRTAYLKSLLGMAGMWSTVAGLGYAAGAKISMDPTNADFMKMRFGNTRLDPGAGFQQYLVLMSRIAYMGKTSSTTKKFAKFGEGFGVPTLKDAVEDFGAQKLAPIPRFAYFWADDKKYKPFFTSDEALKLFMPMIIQDTMDILRDDPSLAPFLVPAAAVGMGTQTYGHGRPKPDYLGKGGLLGRMPWQ